MKKMKRAGFDAFAKKVQLFDSYVKDGTAYTLSEAQTRLEFIDPMLRALGWDVANEGALNQFDREVIVEEALEDQDNIGKVHPDYTFKNGNERLFFLEAKRPSVDIKNNPSSALQIRRYVWSAKLPAGVLTDFEEISIYDGYVAPSPLDQSKTARSFYRSYKQYLDDWEGIYEKLSRDAVYDGQLRIAAKSADVSEKDREPFDKTFLADLEKWRLKLAQSINNNNKIDAKALNATTQLLLDRLIFIRVAEARGVQPLEAASLQKIVLENDPYQALQKAFKLADARYNSGLFHFDNEKGRPGQPDITTPSLNVDKKLIREIVSSLYPPVSPYAFSTVPADLLGSVYERFLGKELVVSEDGTVSDELKPELRKQGGVFYTPTSIVQYMVQSTVGKWISQQKVDRLQKIRVCDPACGSGAFLVVAYEALLKEHIIRYLRRKDLTSEYLVQQGNGIFSLKISEKKRILRECIFGIDIDPSAVEITKLSLLLVALEGETYKTVDRQLSLFLDRALPDLSLNIICANSLLSSNDLGIADHVAIDRLKPLDWAKALPKEGIDILIGNPPYVFGEWHEPIQRRVLKDRLSDVSQIDLYHAFIERVIKYQKPDGYWSLIVPDPVLARDDTKALRRLMLDGGDIVASHVGQVFNDAAVSCVVLVQGPISKKTISVQKIINGQGGAENLRKIRKDTIEKFSDLGFRLELTEPEVALLGKLIQSPYKIRDLLKTLSRGEEIGKKSISRSPSAELVPCIVGENIDRFTLLPITRFIPAKEIKKSRHSYSEPKAVTVKTGLYPKTAIDREGHVTLQSVYNLVPKENIPVEFVAAILNSEVVSWFIRVMYTSHKKLFPQMNQGHIANAPVPDLKLTKEIVAAVNHYEAATSDRQKIFLREKIEELIYRAFDLEVEEIEIVRKASRS